MFKSVFLKYIAAFMLIILFSFLVLTAIIATIVDDYGTNERLNNMKNSTETVEIFFQKHYKSTNYTTFEDYLRYENKRIDTILGLLSSDVQKMTIFVTDSEGHVRYIAGSKDVITSDEINADKNGEYTVPKAVVDRVMTENPDDITYSSNLDGFYKIAHMTYAIPLNIEEFNGTIFAATCDYSMSVLLNSMIKTVIMSSLWIMFASFVAVYFITERFIAPIREMRRAAKNFANGDFEVRVNVTGNDEVAELGQAFNNMASSLATMENMRATFLANVSHDLRTPMTTISGFIDGIIDGAIPPDKHEYYLGVIASEVRRLSRLVSQLLELSRMQAGERKFTMTSFDVCELAREILIASEQRINKKNLDVEFECDEYNMYVLADRDAIHQILYNICDNGIKFSREGGKYQINIKDIGRKVEISVRNEGEGICEEDLPYVFERFYKGDKSRGLDKTGVGLGMFIAKTIIDAHNETIKAESVHGEWCKFTFTLEKSQQTRITPPEEKA